MSVISHVLQEEYECLKDAVKLYEKQAAALPKGYIRIKERNGRKYAYLNWREKKSVKSKYIAPKPSEKYDKIVLQVKKRKDYELRIRRMKKEIQEIRKALRHGKASK